MLTLELWFSLSGIASCLYLELPVADNCNNKITQKDFQDHDAKCVVTAERRTGKGP